MTLRYQKEIVENWFDRGQRRGESTFDRFIYTWIALNAALSARFQVRRDREKVTIFAGELAAYWRQWLEDDSELKEAAFELAERSPIYLEPPGPDGHREEVDVAADEPESVMLGVYAVRNNLFHGAKQFDAMRDHALVRTSTRIIERVFINSGLYDMAKQPSRELTEPIGARDEGDAVTAS
jgi:hypothetical protein